MGSKRNTAQEVLEAVLERNTDTSKADSGNAQLGRAVVLASRAINDWHADLDVLLVDS